MILIQTCEGLANRIRVIASGLSMADALHKELTIIWPISSNLGCAYLDLFILQNNFLVIEKSIHAKILQFKGSKNLFKILLASIHSFVFSFDFVLLNSEIPEKVWKMPSNRLSSQNFPSQIRNIFVSTSEEFFENSHIHYANIIKPIAHIQKKIDLILSEISKPFIGIHIRRTDHFEAAKMSRTELFIELINKELIINPDIVFYLSTDSIEEAKRIIKIFGSQRIYFDDKKKLQRNTKDGIQQALVDLVLLSKSNRIYGSYRSSFSEVASLLGNVKLIVVN